MSTLAEASTHIAAVRAAAEDPRGAYLIRSRLRRALLVCARGVAEQQRLEKPALPGEWVLAPGAPVELADVIDLCRRIYQRSEHLCQPSESFDVRWESGWRDLQQELADLDSAVRALSS